MLPGTCTWVSMLSVIGVFFLLCLSTSASSQEEEQSTSHSPPPADVHIRQNYRKDSENAVNKQIVYELQAFHLYRAMAYYFDRSDVALHGFHKFFKKASNEELEHADKLMDYQNKRGGNLQYETSCINLTKNHPRRWTTVTDAMELALQEEKHINQALLNLRRLAEDSHDPHLVDFIETEYLTEQVDSIKKIGDYVTTLKRVGPGLGEYLVDRQLAEDDK